MPPADAGSRRSRPSPIAGQRRVRHGTDLPTPVAPSARPGPLNHSCDPNTWFAGDTRWSRAATIAAGEELTYDYATGSTEPDFVLYCHCETYRCRQVIEGDDWQIPQLQQRYAGHFAPDRAEADRRAQ